MYNLAIFVSGGGTNLQAIMDQIADGRLQNVKIACVVASREGTYAQVRAEQAGIPCRVISRKSFGDPVAYDQAILTYLADKSIQLIVLAGFLSLLGRSLVSQYHHRIINIHPTLIPAFCGPGLYGIKPHEAVLAYGAKVSGATVHFVDETYDTGPILLQKAIPVRDEDTPQSLQQRIMEEVEQELLPCAIGLIASGRVRIEGRKTYILSESEKVEEDNHD